LRPLPNLKSYCRQRLNKFMIAAAEYQRLFGYVSCQ
jgi:hypothetical protein